MNDYKFFLALLIPLFFAALKFAKTKSFKDAAFEAVSILLPAGVCSVVFACAMIFFVRFSDCKLFFILLSHEAANIYFHLMNGIAILLIYTVLMSLFRRR